MKPPEVKERRVMKSVAIVSLSTKTLKCPNLVPLTEPLKMTMVTEGRTATTTESLKIAAKAMAPLKTTPHKMAMATSHPAIARKKDALSAALDGPRVKTSTKAKTEELLDAETAGLTLLWAPAALVAALAVAAIAIVAIVTLAARSARIKDPSLKFTSLVSPERQDARILRPISLVAVTTFSM